MATVDELQTQLDALRDEVVRLRGLVREAAPAAPSAGLMSRRNLLRAAPVAAIGGVVASLATPAAAATGDPVLLGRTNSANAGGTTTVTGGTPGQAVPEGSTAAVQVVGGASSDWWSSTGVTVGVGTDAQLDVFGNIDQAAFAARFIGGAASGTHASAGGNCVDIEGLGPGTALIVQAHDGSVDVFGEVITSRPLPATGIQVTAETGTGVQTTATSGVAVDAAVSGAGTAIKALSSSTTTAHDAVTVHYAGTSRALYAESHNKANLNGTITGVNDGHGVGVWGEQHNDTGPGIGVVGMGGAQGRGSQFSGGAAQARLVPSTASTHPSTGKAGDLFVDKSVRLWFCTVASSGSTAATWKQIA